MKKLPVLAGEVFDWTAAFCWIKDETPPKSFVFVFSRCYTRHDLQWGVISLPECPELAAQSPRAWEADGEGKTLGTKAYLALRRSSILTVELEQITTVQQEKPFSGKEGRLYSSRWLLPSAFTPRFVKVLCHLEEFERHFPVPLLRARGCPVLAAKAAQGCPRRSQALRPGPEPKPLLAAPLSGVPAPAQHQGTEGICVSYAKCLSNVFL